MTLYLNENISADDIVRISTSNNFGGIKFYPKGVTTNSSKERFRSQKFLSYF